MITALVIIFYGFPLFFFTDCFYKAFKAEPPETPSDVVSAIGLILLHLIPVINLPLIFFWIEYFDYADKFWTWYNTPYKKYRE